MRGYKIVARILLMLSVINFALTAPALLREHEVRYVESNDGAGPSNPAPPIDGPIPLPGPAQSHSLSTGPSSPQDVYTSPVPAGQAPTDEPHPSPLAHGQGLADDSQEPNPSSPLDSPTDRNDHLDVNSGPPSTLRYKYLSDLGSTQGASHPLGSPQIASSDSWQIMSSSDEPHPSSSDSSSTSSGSHSSSMSSGSWASQAHVRPPPPDLPWAWSQPTRLAPNLPWRWSSQTRTGVPPPQIPEDDLSTEEYHAISWEEGLATGQSDLSSLDQLATGEPHPRTLSTVDGPSRIPGPTDNHPQPASPSNPGPSTEPSPPPSAEPLHPGERESWSLLSKISKGKFKRHFSGSGSLNAK